MSLTASGKAQTVTVGYRIPLEIYEQAVARARNRGVTLSALLRDAVIRGLEAEPPLGQKGTKRKQ